MKDLIVRGSLSAAGRLEKGLATVFWYEEEKLVQTFELINGGGTIIVKVEAIIEMMVDIKKKKKKKIKKTKTIYFWTLHTLILSKVHFM